MKLSEVKTLLADLESVNFELENGNKIPEHFHVTEVGEGIKNFIDCGGTVRTEKSVIFQLWNATDVDHRLAPSKLLKIIAMSEKILGIEDGEVEVEYQNETIGKFGLNFNKGVFVLTNKKTDCLAKENCGMPSVTTITESACCTPGGGCC